MQPTAFTLNRSDGIRTHDLCVPNAALYQTEPRFDFGCLLPSTLHILIEKQPFVNSYFSIFFVFSIFFARAVKTTRRGRIYVGFSKIIRSCIHPRTGFRTPMLRNAYC